MNYQCVVTLGAKIPVPLWGEVVYRTLLANCVLANNLRKAEEALNRIKDLGLPITNFTCNQLLALYKRVDQKRIADVLSMMKKENIKPSLLTYRLLIDTKGRASDISGMEQIIDTMKAVLYNFSFRAKIYYNDF